MYEQSSNQRLDRLLEEFFTAVISDGEELVKYISRLQLIFRELNEELQKHNANALPEIVLMSRVVSTLPSEFFEFKSVWESIDVKDRTMDLLIERIRLIEQRLPCKSYGSDNQALNVQRQPVKHGDEFKKEKKTRK